MVYKMKYLKLYEELEDFEETWIDDEPSNEYRKHKLPKLLYYFLDREGVLDEFINNFENQHPNEIYFDYINKKGTIAFNFTDDCFNWSRTPEKHNFWSEITVKWRDTLRSDDIHKRIKNFELYESFDFEETWIQEEDDYDDIKDLKKGDRVLIINRLKDYIKYYDWPDIMYHLIDKECLVCEPDYGLIDNPDNNEERINCFTTREMGYFSIPYDCAKKKII